MVRVWMCCLGSRPISLAKTLSLIGQIADGVAAIHAAGVIHRDIKPENILVDGDGRARITDLGIAKDGWNEGVKTATGMVLGTPAYMAPENFTDGSVTEACDVYSLGVLFYECLSGEKPFRGNVIEIIKGHLEKKPKPLPNGVPREVATLVTSMMDKDARRRPGAIKVARELERLGRELAKIVDLPTGKKVPKTQQLTQPMAQKVVATSSERQLRNVLPFLCVFLLVVLVLVQVDFSSTGEGEGVAVGDVELKAPVEASEEEFSQILANLRQKRVELSAEQRRWFTQRHDGASSARTNAGALHGTCEICKG